MEHVATISSKGQVTVPVAVRRTLGVKPGDRIVFSRKGTTVIITADAYEEDLNKLREEIERDLKAKGLWGIPYERALKVADDIRLNEYRSKL